MKHWNPRRLKQSQNQEPSTKQQISEASKEIDQETKPWELSKDNIIANLYKIADEYKTKYLDVLKEKFVDNKEEVIKPFINAYNEATIALNVAPEDEGIMLLLKCYQKAFDEVGVTRYGRVGEKFNFDIHNAVEIKNALADRETILEVRKEGFKLNNKILQYADVVVAS